MASTQSVVEQVIGQIQAHPELLQSLMNHPYSTIGNITNNDNVSKDEASQVVVAASALAAGQSVDFAQLAGLASKMLGSNGGSTHELAASLLGSVLGAGSGKSTATNGAVSAEAIANLAGVVFGSGTANNKSAVDLSDGIDLGDVLGIAGALFGKK